MNESNSSRFEENNETVETNCVLASNVVRNSKTNLDDNSRSIEKLEEPQTTEEQQKKVNIK